LELEEGPEARWPWSTPMFPRYASHPRAPQHERCRTWVEVEFAGRAAVRGAC